MYLSSSADADTERVYFIEPIISCLFFSFHSQMLEFKANEVDENSDDKKKLVTQKYTQWRNMCSYVGAPGSNFSLGGNMRKKRAHTQISAVAATAAQ